ncbi:MAG: hypothetical protein H7Y43_00180, partial [Akkermansiaceae bacterium]|nr:hypothetical protein [Verrucomicrobiales bacterium]
MNNYKTSASFPGLLAPFLAVLVFASLVQPGFGQASNTVSSKAYVMATFRDNGQDGLHLAWSADGYRWETLLDDQSVLQTRVGESRIMRDPCMIRDDEGTFHLVWTTSWTGKTI